MVEERVEGGGAGGGVCTGGLFCVFLSLLPCEGSSQVLKGLQSAA